MKRDLLLKGLLVVAMSSVVALADMTVDKSSGVLTVSSDKSGAVVVKVIAPDNKVVVNETYEGNSFTWSPAGIDGAYRYDVRINGDYAGGSVEVINSQIVTNNEE